MFYKRNLRTDMVRECIFAAFGSTILKLYPLGTNHGGAFMDLWMCRSAQKNSGYITAYNWCYQRNNNREIVSGIKS